MADGSTRVVYAALAGNLLVAASKFVAAMLSGSSAMLTEAIHSSADAINQMLLLIGNKRSRAAPDATHAFGYGMEIYYWTFVVAVLVLVAGGVASLYQGWAQLRAPEPIKSPLVSLVVLGLSALFEAASFAVGYREYRRVVRSHRIPGQQPVGLWMFIELSKDPNLYESLLEDGAALIGLAFATISVVASGYFHLLWADGAASLAIGVLLVADSVVILRATRSLIGGEAVAPALLADIMRALQAYGDVVADVATLHLGPRTILVTLTLRPAPDQTVAEIKRDLVELRARLKRVDERITYVFFDLV